MSLTEIVIAHVQESMQVLHHIHHHLSISTSQPSKIAFTLTLTPKHKTMAVESFYNCYKSYIFLLQSFLITERRLASIFYQFLCHISTIKANNLYHIAVLLIARHILAKAQAARGSSEFIVVL
jgi:hypothetical protein